MFCEFLFIFLCTHIICFQVRKVCWCVVLWMLLGVKRKNEKSWSYTSAPPLCTRNRCNRVLLNLLYPGIVVTILWLCTIVYYLNGIMAQSLSISAACTIHNVWNGNTVPSLTLLFLVPRPPVTQLSSASLLFKKQKKRILD